jgi:hypothetical protein
LQHLGTPNLSKQKEKKFTTLQQFEGTLKKVVVIWYNYMKKRVDLPPLLTQKLWRTLHVPVNIWISKAVEDTACTSKHLK